jgi:hypothetical protein
MKDNFVFILLAFVQSCTRKSEIKYCVIIHTNKRINYNLNRRENEKQNDDRLSTIKHDSMQLK